jgi:uncharacterized protein YegJ (DUF2314 family)
MISMVLLLKAPAQLDEAIVRASASSAFGTQFGSVPEAGNFVTRHDGQYAVRFGDHLLGVIYSESPYWPDEGSLLNWSADAPARQALEGHRAWMSVDSFGLADAGPVPPHRKAEVYRVLARLLMELPHGDFTALFIPETGQFFGNDGSIEAFLSDRGWPIALGLVPPPIVHDDDPRIAAATRKAKDLMSEFFRAWDERGDDPRPFFVKAGFTDQNGTEQMWAIVQAIENGTVYARLDNDPRHVCCVRRGSIVRLKVGDLNDFMYFEGDKVRGGFTDEVIRRIMEEG